jgi:hypothetical protein
VISQNYGGTPHSMRGVKWAWEFLKTFFQGAEFQGEKLLAKA